MNKNKFRCCIAHSSFGVLLYRCFYPPREEQGLHYYIYLPLTLLPTYLLTYQSKAMSEASNEVVTRSLSILDRFILPLLWRCGTIAVGVVGLLGGLLYVKQESLLYYPAINGYHHLKDNPRGYRSPLERQVPFENMYITCRDGVRIHAWLLLYTRDGTHTVPTSPTIVFFHGNAGNIGLRLPNAMQMVQQLQAHVLLVEYRGYGDSDNVTPTEAGLQLDAEAAIDFIYHYPKIDKSRIFLFGRSLGGGAAFHAAQYAQQQQLHPPLAGVIVENTFTSIGAMVDHLMPWLSTLKWIVLRMHWHSDRIVPHLTVPILYVSGSKDQLVPPAHMRRLYDLSTQSTLRQLHLVRDGTHNETWLQGGPVYWEKLYSFMQQAMQLTNSKGDTHNNSITSPRATTSSSAAQNPHVEETSIPTMSNNIVGMTKEAVTGKETPKAARKEKDI
jgi:abhydrolase domain-containing protein 13